MASWGKFVPASKQWRLAVLGGSLAVIGVGAAAFIGDPGKQTPPAAKRQAAAAKVAVPWFRKQSPPPVLVRLPDADLPPLLPEESPTASLTAEKPRAYEEALPANIHEPPAPAPGASPPPAPDIEPFDQSGGPPPWRLYSVARPEARQGPRVAIVIDDVGVDKKRSARAMALPAPLTIAMLSYAPDIARQAGRAPPVMNYWSMCRWNRPA